MRTSLIWYLVVAWASAAPRMASAAVTLNRPAFASGVLVDVESGDRRLSGTLAEAGIVSAGQATGAYELSCGYWAGHHREGAANVELAFDQFGPDRLLAVGPNPFSANTTITFSNRRRASVRLSLYDASGRLLLQTNDADVPPGIHTKTIVDVLARTANGLPSGMLFGRLNIDAAAFMFKLIHLPR